MNVFYFDVRAAELCRARLAISVPTRRYASSRAHYTARVDTIDFQLVIPVNSPCSVAKRAILMALVSSYGIVHPVMFVKI
jgi:hypothetical protein